MLGFEPDEEYAVTVVDPGLLAPVNRNLKAYYDAWHTMVHSWVVIQVDDPDWVFRRRLQAEIAMRMDGRARDDRRAGWFRISPFVNPLFFSFFFLFFKKQRS